MSTNTAPDPKQELERALAVLESDAPLPSEPDVRQFVNWTHCDRTDQIARTVDQKAWSRWARQRRENERRVSRWWRENVPVPCAACGEEFYRPQIRQKRCPTCVRQAKKYEA